MSYPTPSAPSEIAESRLWGCLAATPELQSAILNIRQISEQIAAEVSRISPGMTDHSVSHMDALWGVSSAVFSNSELAQFTPGEAFILGASFYVHDLGMAYAATAEGAARLRATDDYHAHFAQLSTDLTLDETTAASVALQITSRDLHARKAYELITEPLPGLDRYLLEDTDLRKKWSHFIGEVSQSHHWSIATVHERLGAQGRTPDPTGHEVDLAYVACALRVIDYAHINFQRAPFMQRALRAELPLESIIHWDAQASIAGPTRQGDRLVYSSFRPINTADAWWLFYDMAVGLDAEIAAVKDYLSQRLDSQDRFSLEGVKNSRDPAAFARLVRPADFDPVDVQFRPDSMDRLVNILGGPTLYKNDRFAAVRELLQNARDAIELRILDSAHGGELASEGKITISIIDRDDAPEFLIEDNGCGMSSHVVTKYLLGIASNYWTSADFFNEHPNAQKNGFSPIGRFGIGFLSIFMLGDHVDVFTCTRAGPPIHLNLPGLGRRGTLRTLNNPPIPGTSVRVRLNAQERAKYSDLANLVRARAPMLQYRIEVCENDETSQIYPRWWREQTQSDFIDFIESWSKNALGYDRDRNLVRFHHHYFYRRGQQSLADLAATTWKGEIPEVVTDHLRVMAVPGPGRIILCCRGIAVDMMPIEGLVGVIDKPDLNLDASRSEALNFDVAALAEQVKEQLFPSIVRGVNTLDGTSNIPSQHQQMCEIASNYGIEALTHSELRWLSVIAPPGDSRLVTPTQLRSRAESADQILVTFGTNPWHAWSVVHDLGFTPQHESLIVCVPDYHQPSFGKIREDDSFHVGTLSEHFGAEYDTDSEDWHDAHLLVATLSVLSAALGTDVSSLADKPWRRKRSDYLVGPIYGISE